MNIAGAQFLAIAPISFLSALILIVLLVESFMEKSERMSFWISSIGLGITLLLSLATLGLSGTAFNHMITVGGYGNLFAALFAVAALLTVVLSRDYLLKEHVNFGEFYLLILLATLGMMLMAAAADLIVIFLGLELMSLCLYVLAGFMRRFSLSNEAALKYFLLGAFATGFLLYGIALLYGASGTTTIDLLVSRLPELIAEPYFWIGIGLLMIGFAFKVGAVPFHMWIPDVYQGAPTPVSGFMSTGAKAAAFSAFVLVFLHAQFSALERVKDALALLAAASMILGNIVAISQSNLKRMLAYSSVAHAGYMLTGLAANNQLGHTGIIFYLISYTFMNIGAFGVLALVEREEGKNLTIDDFAGLAARKPVLAALMSTFMLSLAGIPPLAGFFGKYYVFVAAIGAGMTWLAIVGVLTSLISVYYYLRPVMVMYFREGESPGAERLSRQGLVVLIVAALAVIGIGVYPSSLLSIINTIY